MEKLHKMNAEKRVYFAYGIAWGIAKTTKRIQADLIQQRQKCDRKRALFYYRSRLSHLTQDAWEKREACQQLTQEKKRLCRDCDNFQPGIPGSSLDWCYARSCFGSKNSLASGCTYYKPRKEAQ